MSDEPNNVPDNANPSAAPATQPGNGTPAITPEIQALIEAREAAAAQRASNSAWADARRKYEKPASGNGQQPSPTKQNDPPAQQPQAVDVRAEVNRLRSFERAAGKYGLSDDALATLQEDFDAANPSDPAAWVQKRANAFGWKAGGNATPTATTNVPGDSPAPKITPQGAPVTGAGSPSNPTTVTDDTPILRMTESDRIALRRRIGDVAYVDRMRKEFRTNNVRVRFNGK